MQSPSSQRYSTSSDNPDFTDSVVLVDELLTKSRSVAKGQFLAEAGIDGEWTMAYATIARRCRDVKDFGFSRFPYEQGPSVGALTGGFFEHCEWFLRKEMYCYMSMRAMHEYEASYINAAGFWTSFHQAAISLRHDALAEQTLEEAALYDFWAIISVRYGLRVTELRAEFYRLVAKDLTYAKLLLTSLVQLNDLPAADDLVEPLAKLDIHMTMSLGKAVATLSASNATKKGGKGGATGIS